MSTFFERVRAALAQNGYQVFAGAWAHGDARIRARADSVAARVTPLRCREAA